LRAKCATVSKNSLRRRPNKIMQQVKGYSSRRLRDEFDFGLPSLWTRSYFVSSAGDVSSEVIEEYIDAQAGE
jgi:putative transposase